MKDKRKHTVADASDSYRIQSIDRAMAILDCFSFQHKGRSLSEITEMTGLNRSTTRRFVRALESHGLLQEDPHTNNFHLGVRLFELGGIVSSSFSLQKAMNLAMTQLAEKISGTTLVALKTEDQFVVIDKWEKYGLVAMPSEIGMKRPLTFGTTGRVFLAYLPDDEVKQILNQYPLVKYTPHSIMDEKLLFNELRKIRKNGYDIEVEIFVEGIMGIAAPIMDYSRKVLAALCIGLPASKSKDKAYVKKMSSLVKDAAHVISYNLGYRPQIAP